MVRSYILVDEDGGMWDGQRFSQDGTMGDVSRWSTFGGASKMLSKLAYERTSGARGARVARYRKIRKAAP